MDYLCSSCLCPRSERKVQGCCFHPGGQRCRKLQLQHQREKQEAELRSSGDGSVLCYFCRRPASFVKKAGHCYRPSATHPQSQLCRSLGAQLEASAMPEEVEGTRLFPQCALPVHSFRSKGCCPLPGSTPCQERRRRRVYICHDVEEVVNSRATCQYCQRPVTNVKKLGGCYRRAGSTQRSRSCLRAERDVRHAELLSNERTSGGLCIYCELPFSKLKRRGCCSSIAGLGARNSKCSRLHWEAVSRAENGSSMQTAAVRDYRCNVIRSLLSSIDGAHMSDVTTTAMFASPPRNIFITGNMLI